MKTHEIDAKGRSLGRVATEIAIKLRGKDEPGYQPHIASKNKVRILNANQIVMTGNKLKQKEYTSYTGYPGGLRKEKIAKVIDKKGYKEVIRKAVYRMLPNNKLRSIHIKNLEIVE